MRKKPICTNIIEFVATSLGTSRKPVARRGSEVSQDPRRRGVVAVPGKAYPKLIPDSLRTSRSLTIHSEILTLLFIFEWNEQVS